MRTFSLSLPFVYTNIAYISHLSGQLVFVGSCLIVLFSFLLVNGSFLIQTFDSKTKIKSTSGKARKKIPAMRELKEFFPDLSKDKLRKSRPFIQTIAQYGISAKAIDHREKNIIWNRRKQRFSFRLFRCSTCGRIVWVSKRICTLSKTKASLGFIRHVHL